MSRGTTACIDLNNLRHNYRLLNEKIKAVNPECNIIAVVKADAYGHGLNQVVAALPASAAFGVATIEEAMRVRRYRPKARILLLEGFLDIGQMRQAQKMDLDCVIHQNEQLDMLEVHSDAAPRRLWLKVDTGMHRLGFGQDSWRAAFVRLQKAAPEARIILMTHFASADEMDSELTLRQVESIAGLTGKMPLSTSNSAAVFNFPDMSFDWVRVGLSLYGASPLSGILGQELGLKPVMTLSANVIAVKSVAAGQTVGYGGLWRAPADTRVAIVGIGYGDGYPWHAASGTPVYINGLYFKLAGRVSMDMLAVDVGVGSDVKVGDEAVLWGEKLPIEVVARHARTIPYVLPCGLTSRVRYLYKGARQGGAARTDGPVAGARV